MANFSALKTAIQNAIKQNGNEEITGDVLQQILLSIVSTMGDGAINTIEQNLSNEASTRQGADTQLQNAINAIKANIDNGYVYAGIATPSSTPVSGKVFYIATAAGTYTNFGGQVLTQGINILRFNGSAWSHQQLIGIDDVPTAGSNNLVKSGGVQNELALGAVYDVSAKNPTAGPNNDGKWESIAALLSDANLNTLIPTTYRKGGMSIKFVHTYDNKYVQFRYMSSSTAVADFTNVANWQGVDDEPTAGSNNLITSGGIFNELNIDESGTPHTSDFMNYGQIPITEQVIAYVPKTNRVSVNLPSGVSSVTFSSIASGYHAALQESYAQDPTQGLPSMSGTKVADSGWVESNDAPKTIQKNQGSNYLVVTIAKTTNERISVAEAVSAVSFSYTRLIGKFEQLNEQVSECDNKIDELNSSVEQLRQKVYNSQNTQDADVYQVNTDSKIETSSGTRLRLLYYVKPGYIISASCSLGAGVGCAVFSSKDLALIAYEGSALQVIQSGYARSFYTKTITVEGYLCISLKKTNESSFSAQEKADFLAATNIVLLTTPLLETVKALDNSVDNLQNEVGGSYDKSDFTIVRVPTDTEALVDSPNGTRLRCIFQVNQGYSFSLKTTDPNGIYVGIYDTINHAVRAATGDGSGLIQIITNGYVTEQVSGEILVDDGYLSVSLTNGNTAISDSRKQEMIDSLSLSVGGGLAFKVENRNVKIDDVSDAFGQPLGLYTTFPFMKGVNHRGYSVGAPENTLPAYILSYKHGFRYVECDIAFTADGVPVLLHDATIDRTSDGTGNIGNLTYEQVLQYDFGSWFSSEFAGTKIPTLAEFLSLCRNLGLHPFLEIKSSASYTTEQIQEIVDIVEAYGMKGNVTYLSFNASYLATVVAYDEKADVNYVVYSVTDTVITTAVGLRTGENIVSIGSQSYTSQEIEKCKNNHFPLGIWTVDSAQTIAGLDPYISAVTSNSQNAMLIKLTNELN